MITKVAYKEEPTLFEDIDELSVDEIMDHRRGSNFYRYDIVEFTEESREYYPAIQDFDKYIGTWKTNTVIWDADHGWDDRYSELIRVKEEQIITYKWVECTDQD